MYSKVAQNLIEIQKGLSPSTRLVAVSKFHPTEAIRAAYEAGQRRFGESRVQEMGEKVALLPSDIEWHMIGTLQRNKVKYLIPYIHTIHSIDSLPLLEEVSRQCERQGRPLVRVLLQVHISGEETKHGFTPQELISLLEKGSLSNLPHIQIAGLMGMASLTEERTKIEEEFARMQSLFEEIRQRFFPEEEHFKELSIGMSQDYHIAMKYGATYVRIGSAIFGERAYL